MREHAGGCVRSTRTGSKHRSWIVGLVPASTPGSASQSLEHLALHLPPGRPRHARPKAKSLTSAGCGAAASHPHLPRSTGDCNDRTDSERPRRIENLCLGRACAPRRRSRHQQGRNLRAARAERRGQDDADLASSAGSSRPAPGTITVGGCRRDPPAQGSRANRSGWSRRNSQRTCSRPCESTCRFSRGLFGKPHAFRRTSTKCCKRPVALRQAQCRRSWNSLAE